MRLPALAAPPRRKEQPFSSRFGSACVGGPHPCTRALPMGHQITGRGAQAAARASAEGLRRLTIAGAS
jgi:hypothetical protein